MSDIFKHYKPVRVLQNVGVAVTTKSELNEKFPNSEIHYITGHGPKTDTIQGRYLPGVVIDSPSDDERVLFEKLGDEFAVEIPQHKDGYDDPRSPFARSRKASHDGRRKYLIAVTNKPIKKTTTTKSADVKSTKSEKDGDK